MKRALFGVLACAGFAGVGFILTMLLIRLFATYVHGSTARSELWIEQNARGASIAVALVAGAFAAFAWTRITRRP